ncbi:cupin domain-containing protein [Aurantimonas sp. Leaf443]|uniref:cupin domain-containing protein n=1 Tax=Aurantimonas sp. Leaf443 TaxID=1736378 RepID=UPI0006FD2CE7|nr:cupin domain-containing protein [Aurantimonas sp. Leaf443]KQT85779.1 hypothetical protein ASG48_03930 [Aurantimonas sp. Leaf443]
MKISLETLLPQIVSAGLRPGAETPPRQALAHGSMAVELVTPQTGTPTAPLAQDALYVIAGGSAGFELDGEETQATAGDVFFVRAGRSHRVTEPSETFVAWAIVYGPEGGEAPAPSPSVFADVDA